MQTACLLLITFFCAFGVAYLNVYSSEKFHTLFFLIYNNRWVVSYCLVYGIIGVLLHLVLKNSVITVDSSNLNVAPEYVYAVSIGIATKVVADLNLFNIKSDGSTFPVGLRTITKQIDVFFDEQFNSVGFVRSGKFLNPYEAKYKVR